MLSSRVAHHVALGHLLPECTLVSQKMSNGSISFSISACSAFLHATIASSQGSTKNTVHHCTSVEITLSTTVPQCVIYIIRVSVDVKKPTWHVCRMRGSPLHAQLQCSVAGLLCTGQCRCHQHTLELPWVVAGIGKNALQFSRASSGWRIVSQSGNHQRTRTTHRHGAPVHTRAHHVLCSHIYLKPRIHLPFMLCKEPLHLRAAFVKVSNRVLFSYADGP
eukprot:87885-Chlamydomonas_euryale.AAC.3